MEQSLYGKLVHYKEEDIYPFHMPGHKRNPAFSAGFLPVEEDITEITDFDDLHRPEGLIKEAQERAAALYGSEEVFFSVNGSTGAILAAVSAAVPHGGKILAARNSHKSFYNAVYLRGLDPVYVFPETDPGTGISLSIGPSEVEEILEKDREIRAVFITSPTYDGIVSDIRSIAEAAHRHQVPLIVDEAHGAHLAFSDLFPDSAVREGADIVIHSIHKTLPSLTQTAVLHRCSDLVSREKIRRFMSIYQSSSPSYPLMASLDRAFCFLKEDGPEWLFAYGERLLRLREELSRSSYIPLIGFDAGEKVFAFDRSKILLSAEHVKGGGAQLLRTFHAAYRLEMEMASPGYVIAMTSPADTEEGFARLLSSVRMMESTPVTEWAPGNDMPGNGSIIRPEKILRPFEALEAEAETIPVSESTGRVSAEYMYLYPPGIPVIVPGEKIPPQFAGEMERYRRDGMNIAGLKDSTGRTIGCVKEV